MKLSTLLSARPVFNIVMALALNMATVGSNVSWATSDAEADTSSALAFTSSATRPHGVPAEFLIQAAIERTKAKGHLLSQSEKGTGTGPVVWAKSTFERATWNRVPAISENDLQPSFEMVREEKMFTDMNQRQRRATWLYPDDGCFVRATVADDLMTKLLPSSAPTAKIFAFGNLSVRTANSPYGEVQWWYHVASISKVTKAVPGGAPQDEFYVFDPAMNPKAPMPVKSWLAAMNDSSIEIAICAGGAYDPDSLCEAGDVASRQNSLSRAFREAGQFLSNEWARLEELGRNPHLELGANPPW